MLPLLSKVYSVVSFSTQQTDFPEAKGTLRSSYTAHITSKAATFKLCVPFSALLKGLHLLHRKPRIFGGLGVGMIDLGTKQHIPRVSFNTFISN